jgi:hypothetical protein
MPGPDGQEKPVKWISPRAWAVVALAAAMAWLGGAPALAGTHHPPLFGIFDQCVPRYPACTARIERALPLSLVVIYAPLMQRPPLANLKAIHRDGLMPVLVADPYGILNLPGQSTQKRERVIPAGKIAAGRFDGYLRWYAERLRSLRFRVGLSFGHEMNGDWYAWGSPARCRARGRLQEQALPPNSPGRTPPRFFVKAWRHVHDVFTRQKAGNVTWIWTVARLAHQRRGCPSPRRITRADWPGSRYVNWIGIDGYLAKPSSRFRSRLAPTVRFVRTFARKPVLIQETGVRPGRVQRAQLRSLVRSVRRYHLLGWVYENRDGKLGRWTLRPREEQFLGWLLRRDGYRLGG